MCLLWECISLYHADIFHGFSNVRYIKKSNYVVHCCIYLSPETRHLCRTGSVLWPLLSDIVLPSFLVIPWSSRLSTSELLKDNLMLEYCPTPTTHHSFMTQRPYFAFVPTQNYSLWGDFFAHSEHLCSWWRSSRWFPNCSICFQIKSVSVKQSFMVSNQIC